MIIIEIVWGVASVYLLLHYLFFHSRLAFYKARKPRPFRKGVSVVICARNEAENLKQFLPKVLEQDFKMFEVIVVNDGSTDGTTEVLAELKKKSRKLKVVNHTKPEGAVGKKSALRAGIAKARNKYLLLTDADCEPSSNYWLKNMAGHFKTREIVLGVSPYRRSGGLAGWLAQWETLQSAQQYLSFALAKLPYMGVGRNMGYTKGLYHNSDQFYGHARLAGGDDDLFIGRMASATNTTIHIEPDAFTWSAAPQGLRAWWKQKRRHLSTSYSYRFWPLFFLGVYGVAQLLFYLLLIPLLLRGGPSWLLSLLVLKFAIQLIFLVPTALKLRQAHILWLAPIWEFLTTLFLAIIHLQNLLSPKAKAWN